MITGDCEVIKDDISFMTNLLQDSVGTFSNDLEPVPRLQVMSCSIDVQVSVILSQV